MARARFHTLAVAEVRPLTAASVEVTFAVPDDLHGEYDYLPGQHVALRATVGGKELRRSYSICRPPSPGRISVAIKRDLGGAFSTWATSELRTGDRIEQLPQNAFVIAITQFAKRCPSQLIEAPAKSLHRLRRRRQIDIQIQSVPSPHRLSQRLLLPRRLRSCRNARGDIRACTRSLLRSTKRHRRSHRQSRTNPLQKLPPAPRDFHIGWKAYTAWQSELIDELFPIVQSTFTGCSLSTAKSLTRLITLNKRNKPGKPPGLRI